MFQMRESVNVEKTTTTTLAILVGEKCSGAAYTKTKVYKFASYVPMCQLQGLTSHINPTR